MCIRPAVKVTSPLVKRYFHILYYLSVSSLYQYDCFFLKSVVPNHARDLEKESEVLNNVGFADKKSLKQIRYEHAI